MTANEVKPGTRCKCVEPKCCGARHYTPMHHQGQCHADATVAVAVYDGLSRDPESIYFNEPRYVALCSACADWHEGGAK